MTDGKSIVERLRERVASPFERPAIDQSLMTEARDRILALERERDEADRLQQRLQEALFYWMPSVTAETDTGPRSAGDDAYLLAGYQGDISVEAWGDKILADKRMVDDLLTAAVADYKRARTMGKLSKAQRDLLRECVADERGMIGVVQNYAPAKILVRLGLATWRDNDPYSERLIISEAGRRALSQGEQS